MSAAERTRIEDTLRRIDDLVAGLSDIPDPTARESARELVECVLDLHGLALARLMAVAAAEGGRSLVENLAQDEQIAAVLLLYGLHPEDPAARVRKALDALRPRLSAAGIGIEPARVTASAAVVRVIGNPDGAEDVRREIEEAIVNAAPDLDEIAVEWLDARDDAETAALAG